MNRCSLFRMEQDSSSNLAIILLISWNVEREGSTFVQHAVDGDRSVVCIDDVFDDRKPEASPAFSSRPCFIGLIKAFKNKRQILFGNPAAGVFHGNLQPAFSRLHIDMNGAPGICMADRVVNQVG